jgi:hypothetical protein
MVKKVKALFEFCQPTLDSQRPASRTKRTRVTARLCNERRGDPTRSNQCAARSRPLTCLCSFVLSPPGAENEAELSQSPRHKRASRGWAAACPLFRRRHTEQREEDDTSGKAAGGKQASSKASRLMS